MLYNCSGGLDSFFVVKDRATLTIEDTIGDSDSAKDEKTPVNNTSAGQLATMAWKKGTALISAPLRVLLTMRL